MKRILMVVIILIWVAVGYASEKITVELPDGAAMEFVWIEPGSFTMGSPSSESSRDSYEGPQHKVMITRGFWLGKFEITQKQWESVMGTTPWSGKKFVQSNPAHPAVHISWEDIQAFVHVLNEAAGDSLYRLPTEAEWEYACRAGTTTRWSFGDDESQLEAHAWYYDNAWGVGLKYAQPVGTKLPNAWGLHDMHGNVYEWCQDWVGSYSRGAQINPTGSKTGSDRIFRGGDFFNSVQQARSAHRAGSSPDTRGYHIGARLLKTK
jgi:formylglycine-generating enzyme required for sulfatase activity